MKTSVMNTNEEVVEAIKSGNIWCLINYGCTAVTVFATLNEMAFYYLLPKLVKFLSDLVRCMHLSGQPLFCIVEDKICIRYPSLFHFLRYNLKSHDDIKIFADQWMNEIVNAMVYLQETPSGSDAYEHNLFTLKQLARQLFNEWKGIVTLTSDAVVLQQVLESGNLEPITKLGRRRVRQIPMWGPPEGSKYLSLIEAVHELAEPEDFDEDGVFKIEDDESSEEGFDEDGVFGGLTIEDESSEEEGFDEDGIFRDNGIKV